MNFYKHYLALSAKKAAFITVFFWASAFPLTKILLKHTDVNSLAVLRYLFATIILILIGIKRKIKFPKLSELPLFFLAGFLGFSGYFVVFNIAITKISPATASVINALAPAITAIIAYLVFNEKIKPLGWLSLLISFIGILVLALWDGIFSINIGIFYILTACIFLSLYNISQRGLSKKYSSFDIITYSIILATLQLIVYSPKSLTNIFDINIFVFLGILYMAIFPSIVSYILWTRAFEIAKTTIEVTSFMFVTPVLATLMGIIFLGDIPKISTLIGGIIIIFGMILFSKTKS